MSLMIQHLDHAQLGQSLNYYGGKGGQLSMDNFRGLAAMGHQEGALRQVVADAQQQGLSVDQALNQFLSINTPLSEYTPPSSRFSPTPPPSPETVGFLPTTEPQEAVGFDNYTTAPLSPDYLKVLKGEELPPRSVSAPIEFGNPTPYSGTKSNFQNNKMDQIRAERYWNNPADFSNGNVLTGITIPTMPTTGEDDLGSVTPGSGFTGDTDIPDIVDVNPGFLDTITDNVSDVVNRVTRGITVPGVGSVNGTGNPGTVPGVGSVNGTGNTGTVPLQVDPPFVYTGPGTYDPTTGLITEKDDDSGMYPSQVQTQVDPPFVYEGSDPRFLPGGRYYGKDPREFSDLYREDPYAPGGSRYGQNPEGPVTPLPGIGSQVDPPVTPLPDIGPGYVAPPAGGGGGGGGGATPDYAALFNQLANNQSLQQQNFQNMMQQSMKAQQKMFSDYAMQQQMDAQRRIQEQKVSMANSARAGQTANLKLGSESNRNTFGIDAFKRQLKITPQTSSSLAISSGSKGSTNKMLNV